jgi:tetratricopeptide (TPR) repeat protein
MNKLIIILLIFLIHFVGYSQNADDNYEIISSSKVDFKRQQEIKDSINLSFIDTYERKLKKCANTSKKLSQQKRTSCYSKIIKVHLDTNAISNEDVLLFTQTLYESAIRKADGLFIKEDWTLSIEYYEKALLLNPDEIYPRDKILDCKRLIGQIGHYPDYIDKFNVNSNNSEQVKCRITKVNRYIIKYIAKTPKSSHSKKEEKSYTIRRSKVKKFGCTNDDIEIIPNRYQDSDGNEMPNRLK